ncbi:hypothetical protein EDD16DRAFT_1517089 [Pisolithus croceorrhizus]|nr:hypothetical protein EDD16DRAFT_1517089 [Pisolithus croceorrhizus]KAI6169241.1 hypothetical protein EDD17DRAFT_1503139 [Pisolithus thermaeus]
MFYKIFYSFAVPTAANIDHPSHPHLTHPMSNPLPYLPKPYPHVASLAFIIKQLFPPLTSPISPPAYTLNQPHENPPPLQPCLIKTSLCVALLVPTFNQLFSPAPNTD